MKELAVVIEELGALTCDENLDGNLAQRLRYEVDRLRFKIQSQEVAIRDLKKQTMEDPMTGVANRRGFDKEFTRALAGFNRYGRGGAVLLIDVDAFKSVNDSLGHSAGDALLKHISKLLRTHTRDSDFVGRIGGDEFSVILREVSPMQAAYKAQHLSQVIASTPCNFKGRDIYISVSIGSAMFQEASTQSDLLDIADQEMYRHKASNIALNDG